MGEAATEIVRISGSLVQIGRGGLVGAVTQIHKQGPEALSGKLPVMAANWFKAGREAWLELVPKSCELGANFNSSKCQGG